MSERVVCRVERTSALSKDEQQRRAALLCRFASSPHRCVIDPLQAYTLFFGRRLPKYTQRRVRALYRGVERRRRRGTAGIVYVLRHPGIVDERGRPRALVKIGLTRRATAYPRLAEHARSLGVERTALDVVASARSHDAPLLERVMHALLDERRQRSLVNVASGRRLVEYFAVERTDVLDALLQAVARHINNRYTRRQ